MAFRRILSVYLLSLIHSCHFVHSRSYQNILFRDYWISFRFNLRFQSVIRSFKIYSILFTIMNERSLWKCIKYIVRWWQRSKNYMLLKHYNCFKTVIIHPSVSYKGSRTLPRKLPPWSPSRISTTNVCKISQLSLTLITK